MMPTPTAHRHEPARTTSGSHTERLGDTAWVLWRDAAVRGAGFPAGQVHAMCDDELAAAADALDDDAPDTGERYARSYAAATERLSAAVRRTAADDRFREAVTWQNPQLLPNCLDRVLAGTRRNRRGRYHELTVATYLQRYCLKNDSVGFFGPIGWARVEPHDVGLTVRPGPDLLARRTTYFEDWAVEAVAEVVAARPEVWPWLRPRLAPYASLAGRILRLPFARPVALTAAEAQLVARCDGRRTVRELTGEPVDAATVAALLRLRERGALQIDLNDAPGTWPERELAARIDAIGDPDVRARAAAPLAELVAARDEVSAAAGRPERLAPAIGSLAETFGRVTGREATRMAGRTYAGRTLVYEDTVRDVDVRVGRRITDRLAAPLGLVLDSALWLANALGERYEARAREVLDRSGEDSMPLARMLAALLPELVQPGEASAESSIVQDVVAELQRRWHRVLGLPLAACAGTRRHRVAAAAIAERAAAEFTTGPPRWSVAHWHSPDLMVAADDPAALARGDVDVVLGELHCASNTLEGRMFVAQHPAVDRLRAAAQVSGVDRRFVWIPRRGSARTTARISRATEVLLPTYTYVCTGTPALATPPGAAVVSVADLTVRRGADTLVVTHWRGDEHALLEVIGDPLAALFLNVFRPVGGVPHRPRVTIDRLVLGREQWTFAAGELAWAAVRDEAQRYARAWRWRVAHDLPERCFYRVPVERKPVAVDFRSLALVNQFAKMIRRSAEAGPATVTVTEMLPDVDRLWLSDANGARYTAELRTVAVYDPR
jgi:hypothetical protein